MVFLSFQLWLGLLCLVATVLRVQATPVATPNWEELISTNGIKFTGRNAHASCVYRGRIWVTGGRVEAYTMYNLLDSYKMADVWWSEDGAIWTEVSNLQGDYFAQNIDVVQPGSIAPWYQRYGHSLNAININGDLDGEPDVMILMGGFASSPVNDIWITIDGIEWVFAGLAPWSERAWHATTVFNDKLWMMGGTPLNNEIWVLDAVRRVPRLIAPLTRAMYSNFTYEMDWRMVKAAAPWSPRVGMGLISHFYFNTTAGETVEDSRERMLLIGGFGGYPKDGSFGAVSLLGDIKYHDGFYCRSDIWESYDGETWTRLTRKHPQIGNRAWMALGLQRGVDKRLDPRQYGNYTNPPKIYLFGGGYIGYNTANTKRVTSMVGYADAYWSRDGLHWVKINYEEGGGTTGVTYFSSQEWAMTIVDTQTKYLGLWGHTVVSFNTSSRHQYPGEMIMIGGDYTGGGKMSNLVLRNLPGLHCDIGGTACNGRGACNATGCFCQPSWAGLYCEFMVGEQKSAAPLRAPMSTLALVGLLSVSVVFFQEFVHDRRGRR